MSEKYIPQYLPPATSTRNANSNHELRLTGNQISEYFPFNLTSCFIDSTSILPGGAPFIFTDKPLHCEIVTSDNNEQKLNILTPEEKNIIYLLTVNLANMTFAGITGDTANPMTSPISICPGTHDGLSNWWLRSAADPAIFNTPSLPESPQAVSACFSGFNGPNAINLTRSDGGYAAIDHNLGGLFPIIYDSSGLINIQFGNENYSLPHIADTILKIDDLSQITNPNKYPPPTIIIGNLNLNYLESDISYTMPPPPTPTPPPEPVYVPQTHGEHIQALESQINRNILGTRGVIKFIKPTEIYMLNPEYPLVTTLIQAAQNSIIGLNKPGEKSLLEQVASLPVEHKVEFSKWDIFWYDLLNKFRAATNREVIPLTIPEFGIKKVNSPDNFIEIMYATYDRNNITILGRSPSLTVEGQHDYYIIERKPDEFFEQVTATMINQDMTAIDPAGSCTFTETFSDIDTSTSPHHVSSSSYFISKPAYVACNLNKDQAEDNASTDTLGTVTTYQPGLFGMMPVEVPYYGAIGEDTGELVTINGVLHIGIKIKEKNGALISDPETYYFPLHSTINPDN